MPESKGTKGGTTRQTPSKTEVVKTGRVIKEHVERKGTAITDTLKPPTPGSPSKEGAGDKGGG